MLLAVGGYLMPAACADTDPYEWARLRHKPAPLASLSALYDQPERFLTQAVEMTGRVSGTMVLDGAVLTTVVFKLDGGESVQLLARPEQQLLPVGQTARVIARLTAPPGEVAEFNLLAMTAALPGPQPGPSAAAPQPTQAMPEQPRYTLPSRGRQSAAFTEERILAAYEHAISYFNRRLDARSRRTIARCIIDFSRRIGVDARLVMSVVAVESNFNPSATSHSGAMGLGQLMPATARGMGVRNAYSTQENLWAAVRLVRGHLENHDGDIALALACYNAGSGAVRKYGGVPPYRETQNYIRKVTNIYRQLAPEMVRQ